MSQTPSRVFLRCVDSPLGAEYSCPLLGCLTADRERFSSPFHFCTHLRKDHRVELASSHIPLSVCTALGIARCSIIGCSRIYHPADHPRTRGFCVWLLSLLFDVCVCVCVCLQIRRLCRLRLCLLRLLRLPLLLLRSLQVKKSA
jgi:hypothetical protein